MQQVRSGGKGCFAVPTLGRYVPSPFAGRCWLAASGSVLLYCARFVFTWTRFGLIPGVFLPKMLGVVAAPPHRALPCRPLLAGGCARVRFRFVELSGDPTSLGKGAGRFCLAGQENVGAAGRGTGGAPLRR
jgi:hypothetical protein